MLKNMLSKSACIINVCYVKYGTTHRYTKSKNCKIFVSATILNIFIYQKITKANRFFTFMFIFML